jgi:hypothetical protein
LERRPKKPNRAFLFSLAGGTVMVSFSSGLANLTQYYFISTVVVQNSFIIGLLTVFIGALLYQRPEERYVWSLIMMSMGINGLVLVAILSSTIPLSQISPLGLAGAILALLSGILGLSFKPGLRSASPKN